MIKQILDTGWRLRRADSQESFPTSIPTSVYTVLAENNKIPEPYWKGNEDLVRDEINHDFIYSCTFDAAPGLLYQEQTLLRFEGIDTMADIYLNGILLGHAFNMHRIWEFPVGGILKPEGNTLEAVLHSPFEAATKAFAECPTRGGEDAWEGFSHIRKAHYMYGWDWGAHLPDAGIFRSVALLGISKARIDSVYVTQEHKDGKVTLHFAPSFYSAREWKKEQTFQELCGTEEGAFYGYQVTVTAPDGASFTLENNPESALISEPELWWPNGLGDQPLYQVTLDLLYKGEVLDTWSRRIGLRTMTMCVEKDQWGESFAHMVNGVKYFAMGGDYIPEEHLLGRLSSQKRRRLLEDARLANFNSIRVWGGGYYPDDEFFDLCDELGLVVWEDFMFACSVYELTAEFEENITREFIDNIKRLRHHASLGLWCGNNEMESFVKDGR